MIDVLEIVRQIEQERKDRHVVPSYACFMDIQRVINERVKSELNQAVKDGRISFHRTLNDISFGIK